MMKKAIIGKNYGSIPHLHGSKLGKHDKYLQEGQDAIIRKGGRDRHDLVHVSLKLDGTNVGVAKQNNQILALQRKGYLCSSSPYEQHHEFAAFVKTHESLFQKILQEGERLVGEWMWQASGIRYMINGAPFFPFDLFRADGNRAPWPVLVGYIAHYTPFECPPSITYGFKEEMQPNKESHDVFYGSCKARPIGVEHEGLVYRVERKGNFDFMGKWVRSDFEPGKYLPGIGLDKDADVVLNQMF